MRKIFGKYILAGAVVLLALGVGAARAQAMRQCTKDGGKNCEVKVSQCSR
jgi:hypothetical protein